MTNLFTNGAECSGTNAVQGLMKQYSRDRSLQQVSIKYETILYIYIYILT
jgi:hypothetical protein